MGYCDKLSPLLAFIELLGGALLPPPMWDKEKLHLKSSTKQACS